MASQRPPATTPEGRENQLIAKAVDLVERQLEDGTASAQVITHYLKLGSTREKLEQERLMREIDLMEAKAAKMSSQDNVEKLYADAINALRGYSGEEDVNLRDGYDD